MLYVCLYCKKHKLGQYAEIYIMGPATHKHITSFTEAHDHITDLELNFCLQVGLATKIQYMHDKHG